MKYVSCVSLNTVIFTTVSEPKNDTLENHLDSTVIKVYTECPRRNGQNFGRVSRTAYSMWTPQKPTLFDGHYLRNRSTLEIGVLGYIGIV